MTTRTALLIFLFLEKKKFIVTVGFTTKVDHQTTLKIWVHFHGNFGHFIGLEEKKKEKSTTLGVRLIWQDAMCVCAKRKEAGRQATEREIEKRNGRDEEGKTKAKKTKTKNKKQTRMLKTQTEIQHSGSLDVPLVKKRVRRRVRMMKSVVFSASLFLSG